MRRKKNTKVQKKEKNESAEKRKKGKKSKNLGKNRKKKVKKNRKKLENLEIEKLYHFLLSFGRPRTVLCQTMGKLVREAKFCVTAMVVSKFNTTCQ